MESGHIHRVTSPATDRLRRWGRARRVAFFVWAAILSLTVGITFIGVTLLTIGLWFANENADTNPVTDLGFFALGAIIIASGFVVQLRTPERRMAGVQQAIIGILALGVAGLIGGRIEPFTGSLLLLLASAILVTLHPARWEFFKIRTRLSPRLAVLSILAAIPATGYAASMLVQAQQAGPSCFFGRCAYGDRFAELAALAMAITFSGMLAASKPEGWKATAWSAGAAAAILGLASIVLPGVPGALGRAAGTLAVAWGVLFVAMTESEERSTSQAPALETRGPS